MEAFRRKIGRDPFGVEKAISNPARIELLRLLLEKDYSTNELAELTRQDKANTSYHLQVLMSVRLVCRCKRRYFLNSPIVRKFFDVLEELNQDLKWSRSKRKSVPLRIAE